MNNKLKNNKKLIQIIYLVVFLSVMCLLTLILLPLFGSFKTPQKMEAFQNLIDSFGAWGWLTLIGMQILQIIVALIPGELIEFVSGVMFGTIGGTILCLIGCFLGTSIIFFSVRKFGLRFIDNVMDRSKLEKYEFFSNERKLALLVTILFILPGTPKDLLIYAVALTKIKAQDFLVISTLARIPTIITSTYAGCAMSNGDYSKTIIAYIITAILSLAGIAATNFLIRKKNEYKMRKLEIKK